MLDKSLPCGFRWLDKSFKIAGTCACSADERVCLRWSGARLVLLHRGTAQQVEIEVGSTLAFTEHTGKAFLTHTDGRRTWANSVFRLSLHRAPREDGSLGDFIWKKDEKQGFWKGPIANDVQQSGVVCGEHMMTCYIHRFSPSMGGQRLYWLMPVCQHIVFSNSKHNQWITRNFPTWEILASNHGLGSGCLRRSFKSLSTKTSAAPTQKLDACESEFSVSTAVLLLILSHWSTTHKFISESENLKAKCLMHSMVEFMVGKASFVFSASELDITVQVGQVVAIVNSGSRLSQLSLKQLLNVLGTCPMSLADVIIGSFRLTRPGSKCAGALRERLVSVTMACVHVVENLCEAKADEPFWKDFDFMELASLVSQKGRSCRIAVSVKRAYCEVAREVPGAQGTAVIAAVQRALTKRRRTSGVSETPKTPKNFLRDNMLQYWAKEYQTFADSKHMAISLDELRVSGEGVLMITAYNHTIGKAAWFPTQVFIWNYFRDKGNCCFDTRVNVEFRYTFIPFFCCFSTRLSCFVAVLGISIHVEPPGKKKGISNHVCPVVLVLEMRWIFSWISCPFRRKPEFRYTSGLVPGGSSLAKYPCHRRDTEWLQNTECGWVGVWIDLPWLPEP